MTTTIERPTRLPSRSSSQPTSVRLSARAVARLQADVAAVHAERAQLSGTPLDARGDAADVAWLAERDAQLEQLDRRLCRLRATLDAAIVVPARRRTARDDDRVAEGVAVRLRFAGEPAAEAYVVGVIDEQDDAVEVVTPESPLGRVLLGARVGDTVTYQSPAGSRRVDVVAIG